MNKEEFIAELCSMLEYNIDVGDWDIEILTPIRYSSIRNISHFDVQCGDAIFRVSATEVT